MRLGRWLVPVLVAIGATACTGPAGGTAAVGVPAGPDLLTLLPAPATYPPHLTRTDLLAHRVFTLPDIAGSSSWNVFGALVPQGVYIPAACTALSNPDAAPYSGTSFALDAYVFEGKTTVVGPDQAITVGATVAHGTLDVAAVQEPAVRCARVGDGGSLVIRFAVLPNPQAEPEQILAIRVTTGADTTKLTYVAQVGGYIVTAYALCAGPSVCEAALKPVFHDGVAKARAA
ncbi:hypothetical protein OHS18_32335 [Amycolatopsis sp. NBC_00355]|uniref:hypothetical protein n=1 Tax=Amycolatopsis sp. NBC_00355 TaxID=2975957 RepID=UPI002E26304B